MRAELSADDRDRIAGAYEEATSEPAPKDHGPLGCPLMILSVVGLVGISQVLARGPAGSGAVRVLVTVGLVLLAASFLIGGFLAITAGAFARGGVTERAMEALRELEGWDGSEEGRPGALRAATRLLMNAFATYGPTMSSAFETAEVKERLGDAFPLVLAVEEHLKATDRLFYGVFGDTPRRSDAP